MKINTKPCKLMQIKDHDQYPIKNQRNQRNSRPKRYFSSFECFICNKMGNISTNCPLKAEQFKKRNKKFDAHAVEYDDPDEEKNNEYEYSGE